MTKFPPAGNERFHFAPKKQAIPSPKLEYLISLKVSSKKKRQLETI